MDECFMQIAEFLDFKDEIHIMITKFQVNGYYCRFILKVIV